MAVRVSEAKFLEVLDTSPTLDTGIEVDLFAPDGATMLCTLENASAKTFMRQLSELGSGSFALPRDDPKATADNLAVGNIAKFRVAGTHRHAIYVEEPSTTVVSQSDESGEQVAIAGRGVLACLERATVYPPVWPPAAAWTVASSSADNGAAGTSLTVPKPTGTAAGDVVVLAVTCLGGGPTPPTGWTRIRDTANGLLRLQVYRRRVLAAEPDSWTLHWSAARPATGAAVTLRNASADDTAWSISDDSGSGTAVKLPTVSVGLVDGVLLTLAASASSTSFTPGAGLAELVDRAAAGRTLEAAHLDNPALGDTGDLTATAVAAADWIGLQAWVPSTASNDAVFEGATFGAVLSTLIDEAQSRGAIPAVTCDFTSDADSHGEPWPDTHDLAFHVGTSLLEVWRHLVTLGLEGGMTPELRLQAFVDASRHFEGTVILRKGHHFAGDVTEAAHGSGLRTRLLIEGAGGRVVEVTDPAAEADARIGRREGYLDVSTSDNPTTLQRAGEYGLAQSADEDQARSVTVEHGPASAGHYEPWGDYREGDWIGLDADGSGGAPTAERVVSITLSEDDAGGYAPELELNSPEMDAYLRLQRRMDALTRDTTASGSGGSGGSSSGASGGKVASVATDTPGWLNDKLVTDSTITKSVVGDTGSQRVRLSVAPGGSVPFATPSIALGTAAAAGSAGTAVRSDATIAAFDATAPSAESFGAPGSAGSAAFAARRDHVHAMPASPSVPSAASTVTGPDAFGASAAVGTSGAFARADHDHGLPAAAGGMANPMTTAADLIVGGTAGAPARLAKGSDGQVLTVDPATHLISWAASASGFADPTTTKGDLIAHGSSTTRLGVGSDGQVLTVDSAQALGMRWAAGGGGASVHYPELKPATPTYDFAGASIDGAFSAHSSGGSFGTASCMTQGAEWAGSSLEVQYSQQMGVLLLSHADADLDFTWGGVRMDGMNIPASYTAIGIAAVDGSGAGVGVVVENNASAYLAGISGWQATSALATLAGVGVPNIAGALQAGPWWLRLKRVSGTWTGYLSLSGRAWDFTIGTSGASAAVASLAFGLLYDTGSLFSGRITADYVQVDV